MGQQQLLLIILVTIIVGIATVVAVTTFSETQKSINRDAVRQGLAEIASTAQAYYNKPRLLGGGGKSFTGLTLSDISFAMDTSNAAGTVARNANGIFYLVRANGDEFVIDGDPRSDVTGDQDINVTPVLANTVRATITPGSMSVEYVNN